jgi:uncharacterized membrane protein
MMMMMMIMIIIIIIIIIIITPKLRAIQCSDKQDRKHTHPAC